MTRSVLRAALIALEFFVAVGAFYGGGVLILDPSGALLQVPPPDVMLRATPFGTYLVPGIVLVSVNGLVPLLVALAELRRVHWARGGHLIVGLLLTGWMTVQLAWLGYVFVLQAVMLVTGVLILALAAAHSAQAVRR